MGRDMMQYTVPSVGEMDRFSARIHSPACPGGFDPAIVASVPADGSEAGRPGLVAVTGEAKLFQPA